jgi:hypothetical protein
VKIRLGWVAACVILSSIVAFGQGLQGDPGAGEATAGCDRYWAPEFDRLTDSSIKQRLRDKPMMDQVIGGLGGPRPLITYVRTPGNLERDFGQLAVARSQGMTVEQVTAAQYKLVADGFVRIANCRLGLAGNSLLDAQAFAKAGKNPIDNTVDDLLTDCSGAVEYVDSPDGLVRELDIAVAKYKAHKAGLALLESAKSDLLDDAWWRRSSGPDVAARIKYFCDEFQDVVAMVNPEGAKLAEATDILIKTLSLGTKSIKAAYENKESVESAAKAAAAAAGKELAAIGAEAIAKDDPRYWAVKSLMDYEEFAKTKKDSSEFRNTVQELIRNLDAQIKKSSSQIAVDIEEQKAINQIHDTVIGVCVQKTVSVPPR